MTSSHTPLQPLSPLLHTPSLLCKERTSFPRGLNVRFEITGIANLFQKHYKKGSTVIMQLAIS